MIPEYVPENPTAEERVYLRHTKTNDRGYFVSRNGTVMVKFDRPNDPTVRTYDPLEWVPDVDTRPLTRSQVARVAHRADQELCLSLGLVQEAKKDWASLSEQVKRERISGTGPADPLRHDLYMAVFGLLRQSMRD